jgi:hypothetical protein
MKKIVSIGTTTLEMFRRAAGEAVHSGATHMVITRDLPQATWQFDVPGDPYPAWFVVQPGLMKVFCPEPLEPFLNLEYAETIQRILADRCQILGEFGLGAVYMTNEPQVLPEQVYETYPTWRGPRVDHPFRSRTARFAPCVAKPEVQALYRDAITKLSKTCPEVDTMFLMTIDSGSGFCWAPALYPGPNGCAECSGSDVDVRAVAFLNMLKDAGQECGLELEIDLAEIEPRSWMKKAFPHPAQTARLLPAGLSINHHEGPDGNLFIRPLSLFGNLFYTGFYPVSGISRPLALMRQRIADSKCSGTRELHNLGDGNDLELLFSMYRAFNEQKPEHEIDGLNIMDSIVREHFGAKSGAARMDLWLALDDAEKQLASLDFGPFLLMGGLLGRWFTRPLVPYPEELDDTETQGYLPYLFQARDRLSAQNMADIQAMRMFEGWSGRLLVEQTVAVTDGHLRRALVAAETAGDVLDQKRISLLRCLLKSAFHAVAYQAQLEYFHRITGQSETDDVSPPPLGFHGNWEVQDLVRIARGEIDNTLAVLSLIENTDETIIDLADTPEHETPLRLGPDLTHRLREKIRIMNSKWSDYNRTGGMPNV